MAQQERTTSLQDSKTSAQVSKSTNKPLGETGSLDQNKSRHAVTVLKSKQEVYAYWKDFRNLAKFMKDLEGIEVLPQGRSHWKVKLKSGLKADWYARIIEDVPGERIAWESEEGSSVKTSGWVSFESAPANRGTVVRLSMDYEIPGGKLTEWATFFVGESPEILTMTNLKRFKAVLETGEFPTTEGQPSGREEQASETKH